MTLNIPLIETRIQMLILSEVLPNHHKQVHDNFNSLNNLGIKLLVHKQLAIPPAVALQEPDTEKDAGVKTKHFLWLGVIW
jgi:hypothetical protein